MQASADFPSFVVAGDSRRLADFLRRELRVSSQHLRRLLAREWVTVNGRVRTHKAARLAAGDVVAVRATAFEIKQLRFARPLLRMLDDDGNGEGGSAQYRMLHKPAGMPLDGGDSETVESALPALMPNEHYRVVEAVGRIASGPVIVSMSDDAHRMLETAPKRYTFQLIVHGVPPERLDVAGFVSLATLRTVASTTGDLSLVRVVLRHSGDGLRGCLRRNGCPILGTSFRTKSTMNGCFFACTKLELLAPASTITADLDVPEKFHFVLERERRFHEVKKQREAEEEQTRQQLRRDYVDRMEGMTSEDLLSDHWSIVSFCGLPFYITDDVMSPRHSSEVLAQTASRYLPDTEAEVSVLDLGTGSGCLLVSTLIGAPPSVRGIGVDISPEALKIADINIRSHGLTERAVVRQGDFRDLTFPGTAQAFDVVLCNPPYLTEGERKKDGLRGPRVALVAENRGLGCYETIARQVGALLKSNGLVVLEVGGKRKVDVVRAIFGDCDHVETRCDDQGKSRCLVLRKSAAKLA